MKLNKGMAVLAAFVFTFAASASLAQSNSEANSQSSASQTFQGSSTALAASQGGSVIIQPAPAQTSQTIRQEGKTTTRVENAPSLGGLALGGSHPCQWSPFTGQISVIGGGLGGGGGEIDSACMLLVASAASGDRQAYAAAMSMIAARDPAACKAMYRAGMIDDCVDKKGRSLVKPAPVVSTKNRTAAPAPAKLFTSCRYDQAKNQIMVKFTAAGRADKVAAGMACQRSLGM